MNPLRTAVARLQPLRWLVRLLAEGDKPPPNELPSFDLFPMSYEL